MPFQGSLSSHRRPCPGGPAEVSFPLFPQNPVARVPEPHLVQKVNPSEARVATWWWVPSPAQGRTASAGSRFAVQEPKGQGDRSHHDPGKCPPLSCSQPLLPTGNLCPLDRGLPTTGHSDPVPEQREGLRVWKDLLLSEVTSRQCLQVRQATSPWTHVPGLPTSGHHYDAVSQTTR